MDFKSIISSIAGKIMSNKKIAAILIIVILAALLMTALSMFPSPSLSGNIIAKETGTTILTTTTIPNNFCGDGICGKGEDCGTCPRDCNCVKLKLTSSIEKETILGFCTGKAKVTYSAINSGNSDSSGVSLIIESIAPHLNLMRDRKIISLGKFPVGMSPVVNEIEIKYTCDDDISQVNLTLSDSLGNKAYSSHEWRKQ